MTHAMTPDAHASREPVPGSAPPSGAAAPGGPAGGGRTNWDAPHNAARLDAFVLAMRERIHVPTVAYGEAQREMRLLRDRARRR